MAETGTLSRTFRLGGKFDHFQPFPRYSRTVSIFTLPQLWTIPEREAPLPDERTAFPTFCARGAHQANEKCPNQAPLLVHRHKKMPLTDFLVVVCLRRKTKFCAISLT